MIWALKRAAAARGWWIDPVGELARVMRLPDTRNHKTRSAATPEARPVTVVLLDPERRYSPSHFEMLEEPPGSGPVRATPTSPAVGTTPTSPADRGGRSGGRPPKSQGLPVHTRPANLRRILKGCSWLRACYDQRTQLSEGDWYAMLSIVGRSYLPPGNDPGELDGVARGLPAWGLGGRDLAHWMSRGYPRYDRAETDDKLIQAMTGRSGPRTCEDIAKELGAREKHCRRCPHRGITSPILLGRRGRGKRPARRSDTPQQERRPSGEENPPSVPPFAKGGSMAPASDEGDSHRDRSRSDDSPPSSKGDGHTSMILRETGTQQQKHGPSSPPLKKGELEGDSGNGGNPGKPRQPQKAQIQLSHHEEQVADATLAAVVARERNLFQRGGTLIQVVTGDGSRPYHRPADAPGAHPVGEARLREILATCCEFLSLRKSDAGVDWRPVHPPVWLVRALLGRLVWRGVSRLEGMVEGPVLRPDGTVLQTPGYDPASGLFYAPGERLEAVPEKPTGRQIETAVDRLRGAVCDFPFADQAHFSGWLASLLTPLARFAFKGPSPLNLIDANVRGAGKTLLADVANLIVTGRPAAHMPYLRDEVELRKSITAIALKARQTVLFDNVSGAFGSPTLELALTTTTWEDRLLGQNLDLELPLLVTWYVTGNNIALRGDLGRRCVHIRLESAEEKPEHRGDFQHPRLLEWLEGERRRLLPAALTLLVGYCDAGRPDQRLKPWGAYESWSDVVRGTIVWAGLPDPIETSEGLEADADVESMASENLIRGLDEALRELGGAATANELLEELDAGRKDGRYEVLQAAVGELFPRLKRGELPSARQLGTRLRSLRSRNFGGRALEGKRSNRGVVWAVERRPRNGELPFDPEDDV